MRKIIRVRGSEKVRGSTYRLPSGRVIVRRGGYARESYERGVQQTKHVCVWCRKLISGRKSPSGLKSFVVVRSPSGRTLMYHRICWVYYASPKHSQKYRIYKVRK